MKNDKFTIGIVIFAAALVIAGSAFAAKAIMASTDDENNMGNRGEMREVFESGDFEAWKNMVTERANKMLGDATEENFQTLTKAHELKEEGKHEEARQLLKDAGLPMMGHGKAGMRGGMDPETRDAMKEALDNADYEAFKELKADKPMSDKITEENFDKFVESHNLREAGDHEGARAIMEELGLQMKGPGPRGDCK